MKTNVDKVESFVTKDGSLIRELMHPAVHGDSHGAKKQSLALAEVAPAGETEPHSHLETEEFYHFLDGEGVMHLGGESFEVEAGDTVCISPGTLHYVANTGERALRLLCCCTPPYSHDDTELAT